MGSPQQLPIHTPRFCHGMQHVAETIHRTGLSPGRQWNHQHRMLVTGNLWATRVRGDEQAQFPPSGSL